MPSMNIKDPEVHRLARALARQRGTSATKAVRQALEETLARDRSGRQGLAARLLSLSARSTAIEESVLTDQDLYDEVGLPR